MFRLIKLTVCFIWLSAHVQAEEIPNPLYASWSRFKPGTSVTQKSTTDSPTFKSETELTYELVKVTDQDVTLKYTASMTFNGQKMPASVLPDIVYTKMVTKHEPQKTPGVDAASVDYRNEELPPETITIDGKDYPCQVRRATNLMQGSTSIVKTWQSEEIPGGTLKMESTVDQGPQGKSIMTLETLHLAIATR